MPRIASFSLLCLVCLFSWNRQIFLHNALHNWSISQGSSDRFYPPITERAFLLKKTLQTYIMAPNLKKSRYITKMVGMPALNYIFLIRTNIVHQFEYFQKSPPPFGQLVYFPGNDGHYYPTSSIIGAFIKAPVTNFIHLAESALFDKKLFKLH